MVFTNAVMVDNQLRSLGYTLWEAIPFTKKEQNSFPDTPLDVFIRKNVVTGATMAFRAVNHTEMMIPFSNNNWVHDAWMAVLIGAEKGLLIEIIDEPLIMYRQHGNNQLGAKKRNLSEQISDAKSKY